MSPSRRLTNPVRAAVRSYSRRYSRWLEDLIHAVKNELVGRFDLVDQRLGRIESSMEAAQTSLSDQVSMQSAKVRRLTHASEAQAADVAALRDELGTVTAELRATRQELGDTHQELAVARTELGHIRTELGDTRTALGDTRTELSQRLEAAAPSVRLRDLTGARLTEIDGSASGFLNYANSHAGPLADAHLWINHPVVVEWRQGEARIGAVNERIIEQPFVFAALADLPPGARVLDVGGGESTVGFSLASYGFEVTVIEPAGYPFHHPNLSVFEKPLEQFDTVEPFDAVIALSSIEHFGLGHYASTADGSAEAKASAEPDLAADTNAVAAIANLLGPGGRLILTVPYGPPEITDVERIYDHRALGALLEGWELHRITVGRRADKRTWELEATELVEPEGPGRVAMVVATPATATTEGAR